MISGKNKRPLVSIVIPNYNYARYLPRCLESALNQTYPNIEIIIQDNNSTDESYRLILEKELQTLCEDKKVYFSASKNKYNMGSDRNVTIAIGRSYGDYIVVLSSDDALKPNFVERCVEVFENNASVGMVMVHRDEIDEKDTLYKTVPFYNTSFVVDGHQQAAVFMMAGIAVPSQIMIKRYTREKALRFHNYSFQVAGDWFSNFIMSLCGDVGYIQDALCEYRVHSGNETNESELKLIGIFEHYQLLNAFNTTAKSLHIEEPQLRYEKAVQKLGSMCLRYCLKMIKNDEIKCAKKYLHLAPVFDDNIVDDERYKKLNAIVASYDTPDYTKMIQDFDRMYVLDRTKSYDPPEGYFNINEHGQIISVDQSL